MKKEVKSLILDRPLPNRVEKFLSFLEQPSVMSLKKGIWRDPSYRSINEETHHVLRGAGIRPYDILDIAIPEEKTTELAKILVEYGSYAMITGAGGTSKLIGSLSAGPLQIYAKVEYQRGGTEMIVIDFVNSLTFEFPKPPNDATLSIFVRKLKWA